MDNFGCLRKSTQADNETQLLLKSSPNILENFSYNDDDIQMNMEETSSKRMSTPPILYEMNKRASTKSPIFCDTLERHDFMQHVINTKPMKRSTPPYSPPSEKALQMRHSLEEISKDIKEIEDFLTATEKFMETEHKQDNHMKHLLQQQQKQLMQLGNGNKKLSPPMKSRGNSTKCVTYKIHSFKNRRSKPNSPRSLYSRLYFRNGRIGCLEAENAISNVQSTHALVKHILKYENEKPLVSPESVKRAINTICDNYNNNRITNNNNNNANNTSNDTLNHITIEVELENYDGKLKKSSQEEISKAAGKVVLLEADDIDMQTVSQTESTLTATTYTTSVPIVDEDEQDVQICYDEFPEILNEEKNQPPDHPEHYFPIVQMADMSSINEICVNPISGSESIESANQIVLKEQLRDFMKRFTIKPKTNKIRASLDLPSTSSSITTISSPTRKQSNLLQQQQQNKFAFGEDNEQSPPNPPRSPSSPLKHTIVMNSENSPKKGNIFVADNSRSSVWLCSGLCGSNDDQNTLDPQGKIYISWLCVVSISFLYNAWVIPLRSTFPFQTPENTNTWLLIDFCADTIYLIDVIFFKHRLMYLFEGFWVKDKNLTRKNYMRKFQFKLDLLSLLPLELLYFKYGTKAVYLRFPRFFKIQSFWEFFRLMDRVISSPHIVRIAKTLLYMLYMIHLTAAFYYAYSDYQGLGVNRWVFSGRGHPYVRCFAFATKTATSIGKNPKPEREGEYVFMTIAWLMGVFVFALLIGQIRDIISTATRTKNEYRQLEDETMEYMRRLNLSKDVQKRVKMWFKFTWDQQRTLDESHILDALPINLKTDIALSVHIQTLSKVQLFADCEEALLRDLVLKLRAVTFLPGDYVCRKGEVGREMYIVKLGQVQVMGGINNETVLATLSEGSVFGEISLLGINGADRRTADVRSKGFANLFVLSKSDLNEVIVYYPNAQAILKSRARALIRKNAAREKREEQAKRDKPKRDVILDNRVTLENPKLKSKLLKSVIHNISYDSPPVLLITCSSREKSKPQSKQAETLESHEMIEMPKKYPLKTVDSFILPKLSRSDSPDLLSSIQNELQIKNQYINLTDSEKTLIACTTHKGHSEAKKKEE